MCISEIYGKAKRVCLFGSADNKIKAICNAQLLYSINTSSQPSYIYPYRKSSNDINDNYYIYGSLLGKVGLLNFEKDLEPKILWENESSRKSEVVSIRTYDINNDGKYF